MVLVSRIDHRFRRTDNCIRTEEFLPCRQGPKIRFAVRVNTVYSWKGADCNCQQILSLNNSISISSVECDPGKHSTNSVQLEGNLVLNLMYNTTTRHDKLNMCSSSQFLASRETEHVFFITVSCVTINWTCVLHRSFLRHDKLNTCSSSQFLASR
jgi:hypothetical protein